MIAHQIIILNTIQSHKTITHNIGSQKLSQYSSELHLLNLKYYGTHHKSIHTHFKIMID